MSDIKVCEVDPEVLDKAKKFRFRKAKNNAAIIMKIDPEKLIVGVDEELEDIQIGDIAEQLPEFQPRFILYTHVHTHEDGRVSFPLMFFFYSPAGAKTELKMMYAGSKTTLVSKLNMTKVFEVQDKDDLDEDWLKEKLAFFK
eukprot:Colp12_sorted_trinity150504_noHs@30791